MVSYKTLVAKFIIIPVVYSTKILLVEDDPLNRPVHHTVHHTVYTIAHPFPKMAQKVDLRCVLLPGGSQPKTRLEFSRK